MDAAPALPNYEDEVAEIVGGLLLSLGYGAVPRDTSLRSVAARLSPVPRCDRTACIPLCKVREALSFDTRSRVVRSTHLAADLLEGNIARGLCEGFLAYDVEHRFSRGGLSAELVLRFEFRRVPNV